MRKKIITIVVVILTFFAGALSCYFVMRYYPLSTETISKVFRETKIDETAGEGAITKAYDAVVVVESYQNDTNVASGTGFVYKKDDKNGYIITNNHVVSEGNKAKVIFSNGEKIDATILGTDQLSDIAVLSVPQNKVISVAEIGNSKNLKLGNTVFAIGAPVGSEFSGTVTRGIVSGKDRLVSISINANNDWLMSVIQTDAAISPGNSGGPLVNLDGEVIGINSLKLVDTDVEGMGFAIPIEEAMHYVDRLEKGETIPRPMLGVQLLDLDETYALFYSDIKVDSSVKAGAIVQNVVENSVAAKAGLKKGDVIVEIEGKKINNKAELRYELYKHDIGSTIKMKYYRDKKVKEVTVILTDKQ